MRLVPVVERPLVIERLPRHLGLWDPMPPGQAPPEDNDWTVGGQKPLGYCLTLSETLMWIAIREFPVG